MKHCALILFFSSFAYGDSIAVGIRAGLPLNRAYETIDSIGTKIKVESSQLVIGPTFGVRLPLGLGISVDVLHRGYDFSGPGNPFSRGSWEFPVMMQYRFPGIIARPFIAGGLSWDRLSLPVSTNTSKGVVLGAGVDIKIPMFHITPELRYHHRSINEAFSTRPSSNQFDILVGFTF